MDRLPANPRIAVLVHNHVVNDARVIKEVKTLESAGLHVTIFGLVKKGETARFAEVNGINAKIYLGEPQLKIRYSLRKRISKRFARTVQKFIQLLPIFNNTNKKSNIPKRNKPQSVSTKRQLIQSHSRGLEIMAEKYGPFDIYHCHDIIALEAGNRLACRHGSRLIWDAHEIYEHLARDEPNRSRANGDIIREAAPAIDAMITINQSIADYYQKEHAGLPKAAVIMNATPKRSFQTDDGRLRRASGLPEETRILLYQGGFAPHRGLSQLVEAMKFVDSSWSLVMMGWGKSQDELETLAAPINKQASRIVFLPPVPQPELPLWTAGADLGVILYEDVCLNHTYCTPNKLWEYPDAGVPFLASDLVEIRKIVSEWKTGFLTPAQNDPAGIARVINAMDEKALAERRRNCLHFRKTQNWSAFEPALLDVYRRLSGQENAA